MEIKSKFLCSKGVALAFAMLLGGSPGVLLYANDSVEESLMVVQTGRIIKGLVTDANGEPLIGCNVVVIGSNAGVITDIDGRFTLNIPADAKQIKVSYIGYVDQIINLHGRSDFKVVLKEDNNALDEVVVVGYGTQKKATLTGAVEQIGSQVLESRAITNVGAALQGATPGLVVTRSSSRPGNEGLNFQIRGLTSVNGGSPLIIVDGVPVLNSESFQNLNSDDIENISVLKDGSASIYGAKAANGVILVTTKKGKGKTTVDYGFNMRFTTNGIMAFSPSMQEYASMWLEANKEMPEHDWWGWGEENLKKMAQGIEGIYESTVADWGTMFVGNANRLDELFARRYSYQHNLSVAGSTDKSDYRISLAYADNQANLANANLTWEKARKLNVGIDFTTLNQRLALTIDAFYEYRFDIITDMNSDGIMGYPDIVGKDAALQNLGEVSNRGVDIELSWNDKIGKDFRYYIRPNLTFSRNRLEYKAEVARKNSWRKETGKRLYENFVYVFDHFVADQEEADRLNKIGYQPWGQLIPGDVVYKDLDRNGVIDDEDRTAMGNPRSPELMFGIPFGFQYKNFDFSVLLQGATKSSILLNGAAVFDFPQFEQDKIGRVKKMHLDRWTPETAATAKYPALHYGTHDNNKNGNSSLFLYDASYLRLKNVEIGYNVSPKLLRKFHVQQARIYVQGLNLLTFDKLGDVDIDPETKSGDGASWYPIQKVFNFGIDITF